MLRSPSADRWRQLGRRDAVPRIALGVVVVAATVWGVAHDPTVCSVADPGACGPDPVFSVILGFLAGGLVLLLATPVTGCAAIVAFCLADTALDPSSSTRVVFVLTGVVAVGTAVVHRRHRARQRREAGGVDGRPDSVESGGLVAAVPGPTADPAARCLILATIAGVTAVVAVVACLVQLRSDAEHRHQARLTTAVVVEHVDPDVDSVVVLRTPGNETYRFSVIDVDAYPIGSTTQMWIDTRAGWQELVAEQSDPTWLLSLAAAAVALAVAAATRASGRRRDRRTLVAGDEPGRWMWLDQSVRHRSRLHAADESGALLARVRVLAPREELDDDASSVWFPAADDGAVPDGSDDPEDDFGARWRGERAAAEALADSRRGAAGRSGRYVVVRGAVVPGALVTLSDADATVFAVVRGQRPGDLHQRFAVTSELDLPPGELPGAAVRPAGSVPTIPFAARPSPTSRRRAALALFAGLAVVPAATWWLADSWFAVAALTLVGAQLTVSGTHRVRSRLQVERQVLRLRHVMWEWVVPWSRFEGARHDGADVLLAADVGVDRFGPLTGPDPEEAAHRLAADLMAVRQHALAAGGTDATTSRRVSPSVAVPIVFLALQGATVVRHVLGG